jgi:hypothetical protein
MHPTVSPCTHAPWSSSIGTGGRHASERVDFFIGMPTAVLADLAAIHLCGYIQPGSRKRTEVLRLKMLDILVRAIQRRIPYQETRLAAVDNEWARTIQNLE